ncbi:MAG: LVIVD repeat-containing protein [Actinomycetota bacterium]
MTARVATGPGSLNAGMKRMLREVKEQRHRHGPTCEPPDVAEARGLEMVGYHCLDGRPGFKLALHRDGERWLLFLAHLWDRGWSIVDVTDPRAPSLETFIPGPSGVWTLQIQVADQRMLTALEHPPPGWGVEATVDAPEGCLIWDLEDPVNPRPAGTYRTGSAGTHRNYYAGGDLAYMAAAAEGVEGRLLTIVDLGDASAPTEIGRWAWPSQVAPAPDADVLDSYMHGPAYVVDDRAYVSYGKVGAVILDVGDPRSPEMVSRISLGDLGSRIGCHSAIPYRDRELLVINGEAIDEGRAGEWNYALVADISNERKPRVISVLPTPRPAVGTTSYHDRGGRFGPHNQHHHQQQAHLFQNDSLVFMTYFNAGLRLFDISDPLNPVEAAFFVPAAPRARFGPLPTQPATQFEDVLVDSRGHIYCTDKNHGLFVLDPEV